MAPFAEHAAIFAKRVAFLRQKAPQFVDCARIVALHKTAHCGVAIKVRRFCHQSAALWWEKSGTNAAMFSSAAATRLLHSF